MNNNDGWTEVGSGPKYEMWDENADKTFTGKYLEVRNNVGKNKSNIYVLEIENGEKRGVWGSTVLDGKFENIELNSLVRINYLGKLAGKDARGSYKNYQVLSKSPNAVAPVATAMGTPAPATVETQKEEDLPF